MKTILILLIILCVPIIIFKILSSDSDSNETKIQREERLRGIKVIKENEQEEMRKKREWKEHVFAQCKCPNCNNTDYDNILTDPFTYEYSGEYRCYRCGCRWKLKDTKKP